MTAITIARRLFEEGEEDQQERNIRHAAQLRDEGLKRVHGIIPIDLNERIKAAARRQGLHADQLIGRFIEKGAEELERVEAREEAARLRLQFGPDWQSILSQAANQATTPNV